MRKSLLCPITLFFLLFAGIASNAQPTTLALGDIAFTGYNSTTSDNFSFVILKTGGIAAGTVIKFTDRGWWGNGTNTCGNNEWAPTNPEEEIVWTAAVAIPYGRQVAIAGNTATYPYGAGGTVTGGPLSLSGSGDQIFAYQGTQTGVYTMLAGIHMNVNAGTNATNWDNTGGVEPGVTESNKPGCIVNGTHGLFISPEVDNARIKGSVVLSGNPATDRSRINNAANWDVSATEFALPGQLAGLPVDFTWIKASERGGRISVDWGIGTEEEMKDYTIERSADGKMYSDIGKLDAAGKKAYSFTDAQPSAGVNYYRIRATEISGLVKYSTVAIVNLSKGAAKGISVYPTTVRSSTFTLQLTNLPAGSYKLNIHNATGQLVLSRTINHAGGSGTQTVNLPGSMQKGVYKINMINAAEAVVTTIVIE